MDKRSWVRELGFNEELFNFLWIVDNAIATNSLHLCCSCRNRMTKSKVLKYIKIIKIQIGDQGKILMNLMVEERRIEMEDDRGFTKRYIAL